MSNTIESIFYEAHELGFREVLLDCIPIFQNSYPNSPLEEICEKAFDFLSK